MSANQREFTIYLHRPGYHESPEQLPPKLDLPAGAESLLDLLDQARINDPLLAYRIEISSCHHHDLFEHLDGQPLNLLELNHLADRLAGLASHDDDAFNALLQMEKPPAAVSRIINLTHSVGDVAIAFDVFTDQMLGQWSIDNDFIEGLTDIPDHLVNYLDHAKIGKERREAEHGVFTEAGYAVNLNWPKISEVYTPGTLPFLDEQLPEYGLAGDYFRYNHKTHSSGDDCVRAEFPLTDAACQQVLSDLGCTEDELILIPRYCLIPSMLDHISEKEDIGILNAFAICAAGLYEQGRLPLYKAVLEATECYSLEYAAELGAHIHEYNLDTSLTDPAQYALNELEKKLGWPSRRASPSVAT